MPEKELKKAVSELNQQLADVPADTGELKETLLTVEEKGFGLESDLLEGVVDTLRRYAEEWETEHPEATELINRIMTSLSNYGI